MSNAIIQLTANDFEESMDFLNLVFSAYSPHDFANMLPSVYRPTDELMGCNYAIKTDGRIRAVVGMFPITLHIGDVVVRVAGIGGVSTHPEHRSSGYMRTLMHHCVDEMKSQGYHLSWLGGQRQRYLYFGYESCGTKCIFTVSKTNLKHCFDHASDLEFAPISGNDAERITQAVVLHNRQALYCERKNDDFHRHLIGWHNKPYAALDTHGRMVGYLVTNGEGDLIAELCGETTEAALRVVRGWVEQHSLDYVIVEMHAIPNGLFYGLGRISEHVRVRESGNWQVFDWVTVTDALMRLRHNSAPMPNGTVSVGIEGYGAIQLTVDADRATCTATDARADITCDAPTAKRLLYGPLSPTLVKPLPEQARQLESWCPLPLSLPRQDWV
ncbi:MAG: GNAT family N-acetyltransferase [Gemmatimonadota bacterium]|nr:GNAT family N-acetyltransferase [Gemmatimonadota bacterium]